jgi:hypothetical protein
VFGGSIVPQEVEALLRREASDGVQQLHGGQFLVPNEYVITLSVSDLQKVSADQALTSAAFARHLAGYIREQGWQTYGDVVVRFEQSPNLHTGQYRARGAVNPDVHPQHPAGAAAPSQSNRADTAEPGVPPMSDNPSQRGGQGQGRPDDDNFDDRFGRPQDDDRGRGPEPRAPYPPEQGGYTPPNEPNYGPRQQYPGGGYGPGYDDRNPGGPGYDDRGYGSGPGYDPRYRQGQGYGNQPYGPPPGGGYGPPPGNDYDYGRGPAPRPGGDPGYGRHEQPRYPDQGGGYGNYGRPDYGPDYGRYDRGYGDQQGRDYDYGPPQGGGGDYGPPQGGGYGNYGQPEYPMAGQTVTLQLDDGSGRTYQLREGANVIGRGQDAQFRLPDTGVSRRHVEIRWDGQVALLSDLNSTNGTTVNNAPVQEWQLADGDVIRVGHSEIVVRVH